MTIRIFPLLLATATAAMLIAAPASADDGTPARPRLENYHDYNQFLTDMATYKKRLREQASQPATTTPAPAQATPAPAAGRPEAAKPLISPTAVASISPIPQITAPAQPVSTVDPSSEEAPPPLNITGPEDLGYAVEKARGFPHYAYKVTKRYNRSTAQSFPLPQLAPEDLEGSAVGGMWRGLSPMPADSGAVHDETLERQAGTVKREKDLVRKIAGAKKADEDEDTQRQYDSLVKAQGAQEQIALPSFETIYLQGAATSDAGVFGIIIYPSHTHTRFHE